MADDRVVVIAPCGSKVRARVVVVVENDEGTQTLSIGECELDIQMVSLMPPTEYSVRHLWPAFLAAAQTARVTLPRLYAETVARPFQS